MITLPKALLDKFDSWLEREAVEVRRHAEYRRWLLYYLDFCHKYRHGYLDELSLGLFTEKLKDKGQRKNLGALPHCFSFTVLDTVKLPTTHGTMPR
ncbi:MAG: hypothetical protein C0620_03940 [Desulfuromonas sp.]|nr:MAG: hypothetical protein C0620_03940 [Desulfuromonas sp.]